MELNDTAIGLVHAHEDEDMQIMKDLVISKMEGLWGRNREAKTRKRASRFACWRHDEFGTTNSTSQSSACAGEKYAYQTRGLCSRKTSRTT